MDSDQGKLFIGGISWETTEEKLKEHFENYGEVSHTVVMRDKETQKPRGFGFVCFADPSVLDRVLQDTHNIDGRTEWRMVWDSYNNEKHKCLIRDGMNLCGYILDLAVLDAMLEGTTRVGSWHFTPNKHSELFGLKDIVDVVWFLDRHDNLELLLLSVKFYVREMVNDLCI